MLFIIIAFVLSFLNPYSDIYSILFDITGVLAIAYNQSKLVNFYNTIRPVTELITRSPFLNVTVQDTVKSLSWRNWSGSGVGAGVEGGDNMLYSYLNSNSNASSNTNNSNTVSNVSNTNNNSTYNINTTTTTNNTPENTEHLRSNRLLIATSSGFADVNVIESVGA